MKSRRVTHVQRLEDLSCHSDKFIAEVMCQLVTQAKIEEFPERWTNIVDLESAIELYTPMYQLLLSDRAFWRSSISLQLDETIALYVARLLGVPTIVALANNKHPLVPLTTLRAGFRLVLHGLSTELLHALLVQAKLAQGGNSHPEPVGS